MRVQVLLLAAFLGSTLLSRAGALCPIPGTADVIFLVDRSGSLSVGNLNSEKAFITMLMQELDNAGDVQFAAVSYSAGPNLEFNFNTFGTLAEEQAAIQNIPSPGGASNIHLAMDFVITQDMFTMNGARTGVSKVVIGITDGFTNTADETLVSSEALQAQDINVIMVGINFDAFVGACRLEGVASRPQLAFSSPTWENAETAAFVQQVIKPFTTDFMTCADSPCSQMCTDNADGTFTCSCGNGFTLNAMDCSTCDDIDECSRYFPPCDQICINTVGSVHCSCTCGFAVDPNDVTKCIGGNICNADSDILLLISSSGDAADHDVLVNALADSVNMFNIGPDAVRVGAVLFGDQPQTLFTLSGDSAAVAQQLRNAPQPGPGTPPSLTDVLNFVNANDLFSTANGGRADLPDKIILIANDRLSGSCRLLPRFLNLLRGNRRDALQAAQQLKDNNVDISVVGVGRCLERKFLLDLASNPLAAVHVHDFSDLSDALPLVISLTCHLADFLDNSDLSSLVALKNPIKLPNPPHGRGREGN